MRPLTLARVRGVTSQPLRPESSPLLDQARSTSRFAVGFFVVLEEIAEVPTDVVAANVRDLPKLQHLHRDDWAGRRGQHEADTAGEPLHV
jgi:hypothetical protein